LRKRSFFYAALVAALVPAAAQADAPVSVDLVCPVGGETFSHATMPYATSGERPDGKPFGSGHLPPDLPICPGNGLVMFQKDFAPEDKTALETLIADPGYKALSGETSYYRAAWLMRRLNRDPQEIAATILQASWQADGDSARKRRYQTEYAALIEPLAAGRDDDLSMALIGRAANARRELGQFEAAAALLDALPLASLMVLVPAERRVGESVINSTEIEAARGKRRLYDYLTGLKDLVATRNAGSEPLSLLPRQIATERCRDIATLSDDDRTYCAGDAMKAPPANP